jgi:thiamine pyrophosphate-dependent acetolactate synthase large subunit-like protein
LVRANQIHHQDIMINTDRQSVSDLDAIEVPLPASDDTRVWGSDLIAQAIRTIDLEYVALNPGASFRGLHDSLVNHNANTAPKMLLCLHEESAVAIAHGYAKVRNRPMGVILHSNVGLMHGTMGIFNAWCDRVPMVALGATGPVDASKRRPWIDWLHTSNDQGALVRNYTKWDDQPGSVPAAIEALLRANQIAQTAPKGPVYVNLDASLQEQLLPAPVSVPSMARYQPPAPVAPNPAALDEALRLVAGARNIVMLVGRVSRDEGDWLNRIALAERLGASVITDLKLGAAFPTAHPQHLGPPGFFLAPDALAALSRADLILSLDWVDLAGAFKQAFGDAPPTAKVIHASLDQQLHRGWGTEYFGLPAADVYAMCDADTFAGALAARLDAPPAVNARPARAPAAPAGQVSIKAIADTLNTQAGAQPVCLARLPLGWNGSYRDFNHPLDYLGYDGGGGIGSGPGMCVGAALALRGDERTVVGILGDGDFLMGVTALWSACHYQIPLLLIVANNRSFFNDEMHQERVALERGRPTGNRWIGQRMSEPDIDLAAMARAQGAVGLGPIADMEQLERAIGEGLAAVRNGQVCVIDVRVVPGYDANVSGQAERGTSTGAAR